MRIRWVQVSGFRNLAPQTVHFQSQATAIVGDNGQGKTSLLEAIYLLAQSRSFRGAKLAELIQWGERTATVAEVGNHGAAPTENQPVTSAVSAAVETQEGEKEISYTIQEGRRTVTVNGNRVTAAHRFFGEVTAVEFSPDDLDLIKGGPATRRMFLDRTISMLDRNYVYHLVQYHRALKQRNRVLTELRQRTRAREDVNSVADSALAPWNELLLKHGVVVSEGRRRFVEGILGRFEETYSALASDSSGSRERSTLRYTGDFQGQNGLREHEELLGMYYENQPKDIRLGATSRGPHRDDLQVIFGRNEVERPAREVASQGQTRSMVLALKIAATKLLCETTSEPPVLLLDDVESELDSKRREALFQVVRESGSQVILTATELTPELRKLIPNLEVLSVSQGNITPLCETP